MTTNAELRRISEASDRLGKLLSQAADAAWREDPVPADLWRAIAEAAAEVTAQAARLAGEQPCN